ncbi:MAG: hypothetical protein IKT37_04085 [Clostridia bacterium]|nr:hypothetical protein [Clostridia bacterium]
MKKKLISLFICIQMILSVVPPCFTISAGSEPSTIPAPVDTVAPGVTVQSIFPESQLAWKSYRDYLKEQALSAYENPEQYIGYEAGFISSWQSANCRAEFESDVADVFISISDESTDYKFVDPDIKFIIDDYYFDESTSYLWYKVKAAEGHTLPQVLIDNPYILYVDSYITSEDGVDAVPPTFYIGPQKAMFLSDVETVLFKDNAGADFSFTEVSVSDLPAIFDVTPAHHFDNYGYTRWDNYYLGDIASEYTEYGYVSASSIVFIPVEASIVYENLLNAKDTYEYYDILSKAPTSVLAQLSDAHKAQLDICIEALDSLEQVTYETTVSVGDVTVPVSVVGKLPDNVTLTAEVVSADTVISEGFDVKDASEIITALDIKLINNEDGTEWQPEEGRRVGVSIGVGALGYEDGTVVKLQHKHDGFIETYDIIVVEDGAVTVYTSGFSIYVADSTTDANTNGATQIADAITLEVGQEVIYYFGTSNEIGTWNVKDTAGAIHYTVHSNDGIGHDGMRVRWIKINALKLTTADTKITLSYTYRNNNNTRTENFTINIVAPKADAGDRKLYIKDDVNLSGKIVAALVDDQGNEIENGLAGAAFSWSRDDGVLIVPVAYGDNYASVNIARDHSGLVEARKEGNKFRPTTYTLNAILADGEELTAKYTVYYQSEIINADFEFPDATRSNYTFFPNGWPELYWKTTAPGQGSNISKDIEYADVTNGTSNQNNNGTDFGTTTGNTSNAASGVQFAELNAEAFGALYQDIITAPGEDIEWDFAHAPRRDQNNWATNISNAMFIVIGATEDAQKLDHNDLEALGGSAKTAGNGNANFLNGSSPVSVVYKGATYYVWYHDAGTYGSNVNGTLKWTELSGSYTVPNGQYRTRLFFVSEKKPTSNNANAGNLIDKTKAGQYKSYLIEYYEQTYEDGELVVERVDEYEESGEALIYSSVKLKNYYEHFVQEEHDYLHHVEINGNNYPYDIRYSTTDPDNAYLYIESYPGTPTDPLKGDRGEYYEQFDIVMQIFMRDTVVALQKQLVFPQTRNDKGELVELLTEEQKLNLMNLLITTDPYMGYKSEFKLYSTDTTGYDYSELGYTYITQRDPSGNYKAFVALGQNPELGHTYQVQEMGNTAIPGLELDSVKFQVQLYEAGQKWDELKEASYLEIEVGSGKDLLSPVFELKDKVKIADVVVINTYREKETVIYYQGVGNGKIKLNQTGAAFEDMPSETLAFYSGKAIGCETHAGAGATFVGWYKDEACTDPVTAADGVWDKETGIFKPNANIINAESVTFYAKFETGSITINRENANPEQTFVYHIKSTDGNVDMYVSLQCDENGKGSVEILEVPLQKTYTVTEIEDWSWRHPGAVKEDANSNDKLHLVFDFNSDINKNKWLNGLSPEKENVFN